MDTLTGFPSPSDPTEGPIAFGETETVESSDTDEPVARSSSRPESHHPPPPPRLRARAAAHVGRPLRIDGQPRLARDLMSRELLTVGPEDPILMLEEHMEAFRFRHLPVVDGDVLVGLICRSDLLHASSSRLSKSAPEENAILHQLPARRVMRQDVVTVRPTATLEEVAALLWQARVGCVPVTEEDGTLVGIITEGDFVRLTHHFLTTSDSAPPSEPPPPH